MIPTFKSWALNLSNCQTDVIKKRLKVYLPPVTTKVTEFITYQNLYQTQKYIIYLQSLAADVNMPYVNITFDAGTAININHAYWIIPCYPENFQNVIIHLGSFHFLKRNFQIYSSIC